MRRSAGTGSDADGLDIGFDLQAQTVDPTVCGGNGAEQEQKGSDHIGRGNAGAGNIGDEHGDADKSGGGGSQTDGQIDRLHRKDPFQNINKTINSMF